MREPRQPLSEAERRQIAFLVRTLITVLVFVVAASLTMAVLINTFQ